MFLKKNSSRESSSIYDPILQNEPGSKFQDIERDTDETQPRSSSVVIRNLGWIFFVVACVLHLAHWYFLWQTSGTRCYDNDVLDAPAVWEERTFLSNIYGQAYDIYSQDNPNVEDAWKSLLVPHLTRISAEEMARLPAGQKTAEARDGSGYVVVTEGFHQLHCLNSIRKRFYDEEKSLEQGDELEDTDSHINHCFSYLLQSLLCHADVGSMTTRWDEEESAYQANFNVTRTCRNYDAVREWAEKRKI